MKYTNWILIALILTIIVTIYTYASININLKSNINFLKTENESLHEKINNLKTKYEQDFLNSFYYDYTDLSIEGDIELLKTKNEKITLKKIIGKGNKLVYRISDNVCNICFDEVIEELKIYYDKNGTESLVILAPLNRTRELKSYLKDLKCNIPFYGVRENSLGLEIDKYSPFFFYIDKSMIARHIFIPSKSEIESTQNYLEIINSRYF